MKWASSHTPFDSVIFLFNYVHIQLQHLLTLTWPLLYAFSFFSNTIRKTFFKSWLNHVINSQIGAIIWKHNAGIFAKSVFAWSMLCCYWLDQFYNLIDTFSYRANIVFLAPLQFKMGRFASNETPTSLVCLLLLGKLVGQQWTFTILVHT